jgi:hypothetical protein
MTSSAPPSKYNPAGNIQIGNYTLDHGRVEKIFDTLNIFVAPLINPAGRRFQQSAFRSAGVWANHPHFAGRKNARGVCLNRNFDIGWKFKELFRTGKEGWEKFQISDNPTLSSPDSAQLHYRGADANSEGETKSLVGLPATDRSITWVFDIHGQNTTGKNNISYPWSWTNIQTISNQMCIKNTLWDYDGQIAGSGRPSYDSNRKFTDSYPTLTLLPPVPSSVAAAVAAALRTTVTYQGRPIYSTGPGTANPLYTDYGEYLPPDTLTDLEGLAKDFCKAATGVNRRRWTSEQGAVAYPSVGDFDDYSLFLDRIHMRAFTIEGEELQPGDVLAEKEKDEVAVGLFQLIDEISAKVEKSTDPEEDLSRLSTDQLGCPP